jgi:hypothetical protein
VQGRLLHSAVAFAIACIAYGLYWLVVVPWIEPPVVRRASGILPEEVTLQSNPLIARYFPPGAWERGQPKLLETAQGTLLFGDYTVQPDGTLYLSPVTLLFYPLGSSRTDTVPLIVQAPQGAVLKSDRPIQLSRGQFGRPIAGRLVGEVLIRRPPTNDHQQDGLTVRTQNVHIDRHRLWTAQDVEFQFGLHWGRGRDLQIQFAEKPLHGVRQFEPMSVLRELLLAHLEKLVLSFPSAPDNQHDAAGKKAAPDMGDSLQKVELRAAGPFRVYFEERVATLADQVELSRIAPDGTVDRLRCDLLELHFQSGPGPPGQPEPITPLGVERLVAKGKPVELHCPSYALSARADFLEWLHEQRRLVVESALGAQISYAGQTIQSIRIQYRGQPEANAGETDFVGEFVADGPGTLRSSLEGQNAEAVTLSWDHVLHFRPYEGQYLVSVSGKVNVTLIDVARFSAGQMYLFLRKSAAADSPKKWQFRPDRLFAQGDVRIDSTWLRSKRASDELRVWFVPSEAANMPQTVPVWPARTSSVTPQRSMPWSQPLVFQGDVLEARILDDGQFRLDDVTVSGKVEVASPTTGNLVPTVFLAGDLLQLSNLSTATPRFQVQGQPAVASIQGLSIKGRQLVADGKSQTVWLPGPGEMQTPAEIPANGGQPSRPTMPLQIRWTDGMRFDGQSLLIQGQVRINGQQKTQSGDQVHLNMEGTQLRATLTRPVDLVGSTASDKQATDIQTLWLEGPVQAEARVWNPQREPLSWDQLQAVNLQLEKPTGKFQARGPGFVSTLRLVNTRAFLSTGDAPRSADNQLQWVNLRVEYEQQLDGDATRREMEFQGRVTVTYLPVADGQRHFDPRHDRLGPDAWQLKAETLKLAELRPTAQAPPHHEIIAAGNVYIQGQAFSASGQRLSYDDAKDLLILEGTARDPASVRTLWGSGNAQARVIRLWPKSRRVQSEGIQGIDFGPFDQRSP